MKDNYFVYDSVLRQKVAKSKPGQI